MPRPSPNLLPAQLIIAGGSDDIGPGDMLDWISPVLAGVQDGGWVACELLPARGGAAQARIRSGSAGNTSRSSHYRKLPPRMARPLWQLLPQAAPTLLLLTGSHTSQLLTLLDAMANWLNLFEATEQPVQPIMRLLTGAAISAQAKGPRRRGPSTS